MNINNTFKPYSKNLDQIFSDDNNKGKYKYSIPDFQRQYSWTNKNLDELWKDLNEAFKNKEECYFMGSFVLVYEEEGDKTINYHLIDGQQRFTTFIIMMYVLIYDFKNKLKNRTIKNIEKYLQLDEDKVAFTLQSNPNYDGMFDKCIRDRENKSFKHEDIITEKMLKEDDPEYNYINTAYFFYDHFASYVGNLDEFINYIFSKVRVIKTICYDENFAIKMFISLNDRGLPLSNSDNFKSWLYSKCEHSYRQTFNSEWKLLVEFNNDNEIPMDNFIVWYEYYLLKNNPKLSVVDELKQKLDSKKARDIVNELNKFKECVKKVYHPTENTNLIYSLRYVKWDRYVISALVSAFMVDYDNKTELFKQMRRLFYIAFVAGDNVNSIKNTAFKLIEYIVDKHDIDDIKQLVDDYVYRKDRIARLYKNINGDVYGKDFFKPLMLALDFSMREENTVTYQSSEMIHMDHILPKAYQTEKNNEWYYIKDHVTVNKIINSIGNMALLQKFKNIKALNKGFEKKLLYYSGYDEDGNVLETKNVKGIKSFYTTQKKINEYKNKEKKWTSSCIETRKSLMIERIEKLLSISEEDKDINLDNDKSNTKSGKWLYKNNKYNNKQFVKEVLKDYLVDKKITKFIDIPKEIVEHKIYHRNFISEQDDNSRFKFEVNGMNLYLSGVYYASETPEIIERIKNYYNFEYEFIENTSVKVQQEVVETVLNKLNETFKGKFNFVCVNNKKVKSYIQFADERWVNDKMHFEIFTNTADWNNKIVNSRIELHFEKSKSDNYVEYLNNYNFDVNKALTPSAIVGIYDGKTISENIELNFTDEYATEDTIDNIVTVLVDYTNKYGELLNEMIENYDVPGSSISEKERTFFYTEFNKHLISKNNPFPTRKANDRNWYDIGIGSRKTHVTIELVNKEGFIRIGLYMNNDKEHYDLMLKNKDIIENKLGLNLEWNRECKGDVSRIYYRLFGLDFNDHSNYDELIDKVIDIADKMQKVFKEYI